MLDKKYRFVKNVPAGLALNENFETQHQLAIEKAKEIVGLLEMGKNDESVKLASQQYMAIKDFLIEGKHEIMWAIGEKQEKI